MSGGTIFPKPQPKKESFTTNAQRDGTGASASERFFCFWLRLHTSAQSRSGGIDRIAQRT